MTLKRHRTVKVRRPVWNKPRSTPLKSKAKKPEPTFAERDYQGAEPECFFARFDPDHECEGRWERAHLLPKQWLRDEVKLTVEQRWDPALWVWSCSRHHAAFDGYRIEHTREMVTPELREYAQDHPKMEARIMCDFHRPRVFDREVA